MIGIRLADGTYYPLFDEMSNGSRKCVLTPANDNQQSVHLMFFQSDDDNFAQPRMFGSVNLDNIPPGLKDDSEIVLILSSDDSGMLRVHVKDEKGGQEHELLLNPREGEAVSDTENFFSGGDFTVDDDFDLPEPGDFIGDREDLDRLNEEASMNDGLISDTGMGGSSLDESGSDEEFTDDFGWDDESHASPQGKTPIRAGTLAVLVILLCSVMIALSFLIFRFIRGPLIPPLEAMMTSPVVQSLLNFSGLA